MNSSMEIVNTTNIEPDYILAQDSVTLTVYPRIHMFTFDLSLISGVLRHGSLGYSLKNMPITITVEDNSEFHKDEIISTNQLKMNELDFKVNFEKLRKYIGSTDYYKVKIDKNVYARAHSGLGLSTQILGAIYLSCAKLSKRSLNKTDLFKLGLGHYSALGLSLLFTPGMIFEMGVKESNETHGLVIEPSLSEKYEIPANTIFKVNEFPFYTTVLIPKESVSISGIYEIDFWNKSLPDSDIDSYKTIYNIFENIIPSIVERDFKVFTDNLNENIKRGSKPLEEKVQSNRTKEVLQTLRDTFDFAAVSSLGPSLYAFSENDPTDVVSNLEINDYMILVYGADGTIKQKIGKDESLLIASFACLGKTTFTNKYPDLAVDIESIHYARKYMNKDLDDEVAKGDDNWKPDPEYPANYIKDVVDNIGNRKVIFLTTAVDALSELDRLNIRYSILYPGQNRRDQVLSDARKRGNDDAFVAFLDTLLSTDAHRKSFEDLNADKFVLIDDDQYIERYIKENYIL